MTYSLWKFLLTSVKGWGAWLVVALASDRLVYVTGTPDFVTTVCSSCVSGVVLVGVVVGVIVVAIHDLWVYSLAQSGRQGNTPGFTTSDWHATHGLQPLQSSWWQAK